jgi:hypothetical protein
MTIMIRPSFEAGRPVRATDLPDKKSEIFDVESMDNQGKSPAQ